METNPFIWNRALPGTHGIMGRQQLAGKVAQRLHSGEHIAIIGPRGTGKTTFVYQLVCALDGYQLVYFSLDSAFSLQALAAELVLGVDEIGGKIARHVRSRLDQSQRTTAVKGAKWIFEASHARASTRSAVDVSEVQLAIDTILAAIASAGVPCLVAFDEFQAIGAWPEAERLALLGTIRRKLMRAGQDANVRIVFTGSVQSGVRELLNREGTPMWRRTTEIVLPPLDADDVSDRLEQLARQSGKPFDDDALLQVMRHSQLHPLSLQRLAGETWQRGRGGRPFTIELVRDAWRSLMDGQTGPYADLDRTLAQTAGPLRRVLYLVADSGGDGIISAHAASVYGITGGASAVRRALEQGAKLGYVEQVEAGGRNGKGQRWQIVDPLLAAWLAANSPLGAGG